MKIFIKNNVYSLFFGMIILTSCFKKRDLYDPWTYTGPPANVVDTMKGKEFRVDSLVWVYDDNVDNVYILINDRPDLFKYPREMEISLMTDSSSGWVPVRKSVNDQPYYGFLYGIYNYGFVMSPRPADVSLDGKIASLKVKF